MISIICAMGKNRAIGKDQALPWHLPADLRHFKEITMGSTIIMGRKTYETINRPLPGRKNIIITRKESYQAEGCTVCSSLDQAIKSADSDEIFIIGGGEIYREALPRAEKLYLTIIDLEPEADTFFPDYSDFANIVSEEKHSNDTLKYSFIELTK